MRQTRIEEKAEYLKTEYEFESVDKSFMAMAVAVLLDLDYDAIPPEEIVDGGYDKQIDVIRIEDDPNNGSAYIHILQTKNARGFKSTALVQMKNGLDWLFEKPRAEYSRLDNRPLVNKIDEIRQLRQQYGPSGLDVSVYFVTNGDVTELSEEWVQERQGLVDKYTNADFSSFQFREIDAYELARLLDESEHPARRIDADIAIEYDQNRPSLVEYRLGDTRAVICTLRGEELARIACLEPRDSIFDLNVRPFYGTRGKVNRDIEATCTSSIESDKFWFLNNGVTMVCSHFDVNRDVDTPTVKVSNVQIVNGCQTTVTLRESWERGTLRPDVRVLARIYATADSTLTERITLTTNNQNRITDRDLRANDDVQRDIQHRMELRYGLLYERKNREFRTVRGADRRRVIPSERAAQEYLAVVRKKPSVARGYLGRIWAEEYRSIFENATAEDLICAYFIYKYCAARAREARNHLSETDLSQEVAVYGVFHLATIIGYLLRDDQWGAAHRGGLENLIQPLQDDSARLHNLYDQALGILVEIRKADYKKVPNPALYFKANEVQVSITRKLYSAKVPAEDQN